MTSWISIATEHKRDCDLYNTLPHAHTHTHLGNSKKPNWAWVSCCRQETDGLLGEKEAERRQAKESQGEMFPCPLSTAAMSPSIIPLSSLGREKEDRGPGGVRRLDQRALASTSKPLTSLGEFL